MAKLSTLKNKLVVTTAVAAALFGYGRRAYAACDPQPAPDYLCSGATATTQSISYDNANVYTAYGFSVITAAGNAITITGDGALSFTDIYASTITGGGGGGNPGGLYMKVLGDYNATPGSATINVNSKIAGYMYGIRARNLGSGEISITADGEATGVFAGIGTINHGTDLIITAGAGSTITGGSRGINARNYSTATNLTVTTGVGSTVTGTNNYGIDARNLGSGTLTITADGDVTSGRHGILAHNDGTDLTITTGVDSTVTGTTTAGIS